MIGFLTIASADEPPPLHSFAARFTTGSNWHVYLPRSTQTGLARHSANLQRLRSGELVQFGAHYCEAGLIVVLAAETFVLQLDPFSAFYHGSTSHLQTPEARVMREYLAAYNRHDADRVATHLAENRVWYSVTGDNLSEQIISRAAIRDWLVEHFQSHPKIRSDFLAFAQTGPYITVRERASSLNADGKLVDQQAIAIHEIRDNLIQRV